MNVKESIRKYLGISQCEWSSGDEDGENVQGENLYQRPPRLASELQSRPGPSRIGRDEDNGENVQDENLYQRPPRLASELQSSDTQGPSRIEHDTRSRDSHNIANPFLSNRPRRYRPYNYQPIEPTLRLLGNIFRLPAGRLESSITLRPNPRNINQNPGSSFQSREPDRGEGTIGMPMTGGIEESDDVILIDETHNEEARRATSRPNAEELPGDSVPRKKSVKLHCKHGNSQDNGSCTLRITNRDNGSCAVRTTNGDNGTSTERTTNGDNGTSTERITNGDNGNSTEKITNGDNGNSTERITNGDNGNSNERITNGDNGNSTENDDKEPTEKELNQDLLHLLECPVCLECMEPPLAQCRRGHLVCCSCRLQINFCPICRTTFSSTRNRAMEGHSHSFACYYVPKHHVTWHDAGRFGLSILKYVAELVLYPCRHECGKRMRLRRRLSHEASCEARRYSCPMSRCSVLQAPVPHEELVQHIKSIHNASIKIGEEQRLLITTACRKNEWMLLAHHELFQLRTRIEQGHFDLYVAYIGPKCNSTRYIYKVTVQGKSKARRVTYSRYTHSDQESCQQTLARQDCFHLSVEQVVNMQRDRDGQGSAPGMLDLRLRLIDTSSKDKTDS